METDILNFLYISYGAFKQKLKLHKENALHNFKTKNWDSQRNATKSLLLDNEELYKECFIKLSAYQDIIKQGKVRFSEKHFPSQEEWEFRSFVHLFLQRYYHSGISDHFSFENINQKKTIGITIELGNDIPSFAKELLQSISFDSVGLTTFSSFIKKYLGDYFGKNGSYVEIFPKIFFRNKHAYLLGNLYLESERYLVFCIPFINENEGIKADAFLTGEREIKKIFEFTRSYLLVNEDDIAGLISFIKCLLPSKPTDQLAINLGFLNLGKYLMQTRLYLHLEKSNEKVDIAPGIKGMVMSVFTMPSYNGVIKIINDESKPPKETDKELVKKKYNLVALHDRAGRLADTQEFFNMKFFKHHFTPAAFLELIKETNENLVIENDNTLLIKHLYLERKMVPLNIYLKEVDESTAEKAIIEYGNAIRDLAHINIFPGDLLLKNFGVTDGERVVFYDYDEITFVTECNFRFIPVASSFEEEISGEKWFFCDTNDIFPEEFLKFLLWDEKHKEVFMKHHADLLTPAFWNGVKEVHKKGLVVDIAPYYSKD